MSNLERKFTLKHTIPNISAISALEDGQDFHGESEKNLNRNWAIIVKKNPEGDRFGVSCSVMNPEFIRRNLRGKNQKNVWSIKTEYEMKLNGETVEGGKKTFENDDSTLFLENSELIINSSLTVECQISVKKVIGIQVFDESMKKYSDVILVADGEEFYVSKLFLASQSEFFDATFFGNFKETCQNRIELKDVNPEHFQSFLELLYGHQVIQNNNIQGILHLSDRFLSPIAVHRCEEYLLNSLSIPRKEKLELSVKYRLDKLKTYCLNQIICIADIRDVVPENAREMDHDLLAEMFQRLMGFAWNR